MVDQRNVVLAVHEKIRTKESFTAFDITAALRDAGHVVTHGDIREAIHDTAKKWVDEGWLVSENLKEGDWSALQYRPAGQDSGDSEDIDI